MKKLILLFTIVLFALVSFGQQLDNEFYFRLGYSSPSWSQFGITQNNWDEIELDSKEGASFELGNIFMINRILKKNNMSLGVNVDYLYLNYNNFTNKNNNLNLGHVRIGSKIGPSFTYSPANKLEFDIYAKADLAWASAAVIYQENIDDAEDYYLGKTAFGFSTGINIRYSILMLGFEFNTVSPELESDDFPGEYLQDIINDEFNTGEDTKSPLPCMNFTIGLSF